MDVVDDIIHSWLLAEKLGRTLLLQPRICNRFIKSGSILLLLGEGFRPYESEVR